MKNIITLVVLFVVAVVTFNASAKTVSNINTRDAQACGEYLIKHPDDTIVEVFNLKNNAEVTRKVWLKSANILSFRNDTVVRRKVTQERVKILSADNVNVKDRVVEMLSNDRPRDVVYAESAIDNSCERVTLKVTGQDIWRIAVNNSFAYQIGHCAELYRPSLPELVYVGMIKARVAERKAEEAKRQTRTERVMLCGGYLLFCIAGPLFGARTAKKRQKN